jgi:Mycothiol maleylpyruvate isomerase N-terminal domain
MSSGLSSGAGVYAFAVTSSEIAASEALESRRVRFLVVEAVEAAAELIGTETVAARWDEPSALAGMTVGALCAHLVRAAGSVLAYLDRTDPGARLPEALLTPVTYFHAAIDSPIHDRIKEVSANEAAAGSAAVACHCGDVAAEMRTRLAEEPTDRLVAALGGRMLSLDDFCRTRLIEVLLHLDDVAASVGVSPPDTSADGRSIVIDILIGIARLQHGDWPVLHALARDERRAVDVFPVF